MHFFLQNDKYTIDKEILDVKYLLSNFGNQYTHDVDEISEKEIATAKFGQGINIPIGTIGFVGAFLKNMKGSSYMKPLEIPEFLRKKEYLKRHYEICKFKDLPKTGTYFIKDASLLKNWEADAFFMPLLRDMIPKFQDDWEEHEYVCSEVVDKIFAEYRVLVHEDKVVGVQYYSGLKIRDSYDDYRLDYESSGSDGILYFPDSDTIKNIVLDIKKYRTSGGKFPLSYTLDIAVTPRGTILLEVHNFVSCGTYGYCEKNLLDMYRNGIEYELTV